jgi:hypothetical protein
MGDRPFNTPRAAERVSSRARARGSASRAAAGTATGAGIGAILDAVALAAWDREPRPPYDRPEVDDRPAKGGLEMTTSDDFDRFAYLETDPVPASAEVDPNVSPEMLDPPAEDRDRLAHDVHDTLVHQMFAISLDLHAALAGVEHDTGHRPTADRIRQALSCLDQAVSDLRIAVVDHGKLSTPEDRDPTSHPSPSGG